MGIILYIICQSGLLMYHKISSYPQTLPCNFGIAVKMHREELQLLQEPGSHVGEVVKVMGKSKVLVKVCLLSFFSLFTFLTWCMRYEHVNLVLA
jgi:hypothetical protein